MEVFEFKDALRSHLDNVRRSGRRIALVPTMGNLHAGHMALVEEARRHCDYVVASIFVNPMQFGPSEDFERYPRTFQQDLEGLLAAGCHALFAPAVNEMYPAGLAAQTLVAVPELSELHCGASRPGHFNGVTTVVCKLFNIVAPEQAFFGLKDYQQLLIIRRMAADLCMPVQVRGVPIQRAPSGLALSSRNGYLDDRQLAIAASLHAVLGETRDAILAGASGFTDLEQTASKKIEAAGMQPEYFTICHAATLLPATPYDKELVILAAVHLGATRLIDNVTINLPL